MSGDVHVRFRERLGGRFPGATRLVVCFQYKPDAERFRAELGKRLGKFGLEVKPTKTKVMEFGRFAVQNAKRRGGRAETFDFLGLTHLPNKEGRYRLSDEVCNIPQEVYRQAEDLQRAAEEG